MRHIKTQVWLMSLLATTTGRPYPKANGGIV